MRDRDARVMAALKLAPASPYIGDDWQYSNEDNDYVQEPVYVVQRADEETFVNSSKEDRMKKLYLVHINDKNLVCAHIYGTTSYRYVKCNSFKAIIQAVALRDLL